MPRRKKGAGLNEHVENYIEEEEDFRPDQNLLDKHRNRYYKAYAEANRMPLKVKKPLLMWLWGYPYFWLGSIFWSLFKRYFQTAQTNVWCSTPL